jgi:hypothetical protein
VKHTPKLIVEDETNTPRLRLIVRCRECGVIVTNRLVDVSMLDKPAGDTGTELGEQDALE